MTEPAMVDTSECATAEDLQTLTFEAMSASNTKIPSAKQWMERGEKNRVVLALGWGLLRHSNTELAKIIRDGEPEEGAWCDLYDSLCEIEGFYKAVLTDIDMITARLLVALSQALPEENN